METQLCRSEQGLRLFSHLSEVYWEPQQVPLPLTSLQKKPHHLSTFTRVCVTCSFSPAHTEWLQSRAVPTGTRMGSVSIGREEARGQRNKFQQGQLQAVETWVGRLGKAYRSPVAGETRAPLGHAFQDRLLP